MKYKVSKKLGAYSVASALLVNNVPVFAEEISENVAIVDYDSQKEEIIEDDAQDTTQFVESQTEATTQQSIDNNEVKTYISATDSTTDHITSAIETVVTEDVNVEDITVDNNNLKVKDVPLFIQNSENNPTIEKITDDNRDTIGKYDTEGAGNNDGIVSLSERLSWEIKNAITKSLEVIGKGIVVPQFNQYTLQTENIQNMTVTISEKLAQAANISNGSGSSDNGTVTVNYSNLQSVKTLDLSDQGLTKEDLKGIEYFQGLKNLDLSGNNGLFTPEDTASLSTTTQIAPEPVEGLKQILTLKNLQTLNLSRTGLTTFGHQEFANLPALETVNLSYNAITKFEKINLKDNTTLQEINLRGNDLTHIQDINIPNLITLDIDFIDTITEISNINLPSVTKFDISSCNKLVNMRRVNLDSLDRLDITSDALKEIRKISLKNAYRLYIVNNNPEALQYRENSVGKLDYIDAPNVREINTTVQFGKVTYINLESYTGNIQLTHVEGDSNPMRGVEFSNLNIPKATGFKFKSSEGIYGLGNMSGKYYRPIRNINADSVTNWEQVGFGWHSYKYMVYENVSINSVKNFKFNQGGWNNTVFERAFNVSAESLTELRYVRWRDVEEAKLFHLENVYLPKVEIIREFTYGEGDNYQPYNMKEAAYKNVNLDSLKNMEVSGVTVDQGDIRLDRAENISIKNMTGIVANIDRTLNEGFNLKDIVGPKVKKIVIKNKQQFNNINDVINFQKLEEVEFFNTNLSDITPLEGIKKGQIKKVNLQGSKVKDIATLTKLGDGLTQINTTDQKIDYKVYKGTGTTPEGEAKLTRNINGTVTVTLKNPVKESTNTLFNANQITIDGFQQQIDNGSWTNVEGQASYDNTQKVITWTNIPSNVTKLKFNFSVPYTLNGIPCTYSGVGTVTVVEGEQPESEKYDYTISGMDTVTYTTIDEINKFNENPTNGVSLQGLENTADLSKYKINVYNSNENGTKGALVGTSNADGTGFQPVSVDGEQQVPKAIENPQVGRKKLFKVQYEVVKISDTTKEQGQSQNIVVATGQKNILVSNNTPEIVGLPNAFYYFYGDEVPDFKQGITVRDDEDGDLNINDLKVTGFDKAKVDKYNTSIQYVTFSISDKTGNTTSIKVPVYINYKDVSFSDDLKSAICAQLGKDEDEKITIPELDKITRLDVPNATDITGIQFLPNLEVLNLSNSNIEECQRMTLSSLRELNLTNANTKVLEFLSLTSLQTLTLDNTQTQTITKQIDLPNLRTLNIQNGSIKILEKMNLPKVVTLNLSNTSYEIINNNVDLPSVTNLNLNGGDLGILGKLNLPQLRTLDINDTNYRAFATSNLPSLTTLNMQNSNLKVLEHMNMPNVQVIDANNATYEELKNDINLPELTTLKIDNSDTRILNHLNASNLITIEARNSTVYISGTKVFEKLTTLRLNNATVDGPLNIKGAFPNLLNLYMGDMTNLQNSHLNSLSESIEILELRGNTEITALNTEQLPNLVKLWLRESNVNITPEAINKMSKLTSLSLPETITTLNGLNLEDLLDISIPSSITEISGVDLPSLTNLTLTEGIIKFTENHLPAVTSLTAPSGMTEFCDNNLPELRSLTLSQTVQYFNNNITPKMNSFTLQGNANSELKEFCGNDVSGWNWSNGYEFRAKNLQKISNNNFSNLPKINISTLSNLKEFCGNNLARVTEFTWFGTDTNKKEYKLEKFNDNNLSSLTGRFEINQKSLKEVSRNNLSKIHTFKVLTRDFNSEEGAMVTDNTFSDLLRIVHFQGKFKLIRGINSKGVGNNNNDGFVLWGATKIDKLEDCNVPNMQIKFQDTGQRINTVEDCVFFKTTTNSGAKFNVANIINVKFTNSSNSPAMGVTNIEYATFTPDSKFNAIWLKQNKIKDIDDLYNSLKDVTVSGAIEIQGQRPEVTIYMDEYPKSRDGSFTVPLEEIFDADEASKAANSDSNNLQFQRPNSNDTGTVDIRQASSNSFQTSTGSATAVIDKSGENGKGTVTFTNVTTDSVAKIKVSGNVRIANQNKPLSPGGANGINDTIVTVRFINGSESPRFTKFEDAKIGVAQLEGGHKTTFKLSDGIEVKGGTFTTNITQLPRKEDIAVNTAQSLEVVYTAVKSNGTARTDEETPVTKTRYITISNYAPQFTIPNGTLYITTGATTRQQEEGLLTQLTKNVTVTDYEDQQIYPKLKPSTKEEPNANAPAIKVFLVNEEGEDTLIDENTAMLQAGEHTIKYTATDTDGNTTEVTRTVVIQQNNYLLGISNDPIVITGAQLAEYNSQQNMNGVTLLPQYASTYTLTKEFEKVTDSPQGKTTTKIELPTATKRPETEEEAIAQGTKYKINYKATQRTGTQDVAQESITNKVLGSQIVIVTNYLPEIHFAEEQDGQIKEIYTGTSAQPLAGVTVSDFEDDKNGRTIVPIPKAGDGSSLDIASLEAGEHTIIYAVSDADKNIVEKTRTLRIVDKLGVSFTDNISMTNGTDIDVLEGLKVTRKGQAVNIKTQDDLQVKYTLTDSQNNIEQFNTAEEIQQALKGKENGIYSLKYKISYKDEEIREKVETNARKITISSISIPDANLVVAINRQLGRDERTVITPDDLNKLTILNASSMGIKDTTGLEYATNLEILNLSNNQIDGINLPSSTKLREINLSNNQIRESKNVTLPKTGTIEALDLSLNSMYDIDLDLPTVKQVDLSSNASLQVVRINAPKLETLNLSGNRISAINLQGVNPDLKNINLSSNRLTKFTGTDFNQFIKLETLNLSSNQIDTVSNVDLSSLTSLNLKNNQIETINGLTVNSLKSLDLSKNKLTTVNGLVGAKLETLNLSNNKLATLNLTSNSILTLKVADNALTSLNGMNLSSLENLDISRNKISNVNTIVNKFTNLKTLAINESKVSELRNINLDRLDATDNPIITIQDCNIQSGDIGVGSIVSVVKSNVPSLNLNDSPTLKTLVDSTVNRINNNSNLQELNNITLVGAGNDIYINSTHLHIIENINIPEFEKGLHFTGSNIKTVQNINAPKAWGIKVGNNVETVQNLVVGTEGPSNAQGINVDSGSKLTNIKNVQIRDNTLDFLKTVKEVEDFTIVNEGAINFTGGMTTTSNNVTTVNKFDKFTNINLPNATTVTLDKVFNPNALGTLNAPKATTISVQDNGFTSLEEIQGINASDLVKQINLNNNNISDISNVNNVVQNITDSENAIFVNLDRNRIQNIQPLENTQHTVYVREQKLDGFRQFARLTQAPEANDPAQPETQVGEAAMTINPADLLGLPDTYKTITVEAVNENGIVIEDQSTIDGGTVSDNGTRNATITWNQVLSNDTQKTFKVTAIQQDPDVQGQTKAMPYTYSAIVTVEARDNSTPYLEFESGQQNIKLSPKVVTQYNLLDGLKFAGISTTKAIANVPNGYKVKVYLKQQVEAGVEDGITEQKTEITKLDAVATGENKQFDLVYELIKTTATQDSSIDENVVDTIERTIKVTNNAPTMKKYPTITIQVERDGTINKDNLKELLKKESLEKTASNIIATDVEDIKITNIIEDESELGKLAKGRSAESISNGIVLPQIPEDMGIGTHTLTYIIIDSDGNRSIQQRDVVVKTNTPPKIELFENVMMNLSSARNFEPLDLVKSVTDVEDNVFIQPVVKNKEVVEQIKAYASKDNLNKQELKTFEVIFTATDSAGNISEAKTTVTITNRKPNLVLTKGDLSTKQGLTLNLLNKVESATDEEDGTPNVIVKLDGQVINNPSQFDTSNLQVNKTYTLEYIAQDNDGNVTSPQTRKLTLLADVVPVVSPKSFNISITPSKVDTFEHSQGIYLTYGTETVLVSGLHITVKSGSITKNVPVNSSVDCKVVYNDFRTGSGDLIPGFERTITVSNYAPIVSVKQNKELKEGDTITKEQLISFLNVTDEDSLEELKIEVNEGKLSLINLKAGTYEIEYIVTDTDGNTVIEKLSLKVKSVSDFISQGSGVTINGGSEETSKEDKSEENLLKQEVEKPSEKEEVKSLKDTINLPKIDKAQEVKFNDITKNYWAAPSIAKMSSAGILKGDGNGNFNASQATKRADVAIMFVNLLGLENEAKQLETKTSFKDIRQDKYYANYVEVVKQYGIVSGVGNDKFNPEGTVSRQDVMVMASRVLKQLGVEPSEAKKVSFSDANTVSDYAKESIDYLVNLGVVKGDDNKINPKQNITRAEMSVMLDNMYTIIDNQNK